MNREGEQSDRAADVELVDLFRLFWFGRYLLLRFVIVFAVVGVAVSLQLPNEYRSEAKFKPADSEMAGLPAAGLLSQVGALAGLADLSGRGSAIMAVETLKSRPFIVDFVRRRNLVVPLMAATRWDPVSGALMLDTEMYDPTTKTWLRPPKPPRTSEPTDDEIYDRFRDILEVEHDPETGLVTVAITFYSPVFAEQWLRWMVLDLNEQLRRREIAIRERSIGYLSQKLRQNDIATLDHELGSLLKTEIRDHMLAQVREEYALETIAPPYQPRMKSGPNRALICVAVTFFGALCGMLYLLIRQARQPYTVRPPFLPLGKLSNAGAVLRRRWRRA